MWFPILVTQHLRSCISYTLSMKVQTFSLSKKAFEKVCHVCWPHWIFFNHKTTMSYVNSGYTCAHILQGWFDGTIIAPVPVKITLKIDDSYGCWYLMICTTMLSGAMVLNTKNLYLGYSMKDLNCRYSFRVGRGQKIYRCFYVNENIFCIKDMQYIKDCVSRRCYFSGKN